MKVDVISNSNLEKSPRPQQPVSSSDFIHLIWQATGLAFATALLLLMISGRGFDFDRENFVLFIVATEIGIAAATAFVSSAWSVFGPGSYLKRLICSHLVSAIVGLGYLVGAVLFVALGEFGVKAWIELTDVVKYAVLAIPIVTIAAQLPFWFFRVFFGWQFTFRQSAPAQSFTLKDVFAFTFLVALGFTALQTAANQDLVNEWFDPTISYEEVTHPDGTTTWEEVKTTDPAEINQRLLAHQRMNRSRVLSAYGVIALLSFVISLLSLPALLTMFGTKETEAGCGFMFVYAICWTLIIVLAAAAIFPGFVLGFIAVFVFTHCGLISISLAISRERGFRLVSLRRLRQQQNLAEASSA